MKDLVIGKIRFVNHGRTLYKQEVRQTFQEYGKMSLKFTIVCINFKFKGSSRKSQ